MSRIALDVFRIFTKLAGLGVGADRNGVRSDIYRRSDVAMRAYAETEKRLSEQYLDQVIEAAYLHSKLNCYFVGPFARRVSFASQQLRALDLIEALNHRDKIDSTQKVAVIGGGLAGLSAVAKLCSLNYQVDVYETESHVLSRQRGATHRLVHPTISRWPLEPVNLTTELPFFDWGVAPCESILTTLKREWDTYFGPNSKLSGKVDVINAKVVGLAPNLRDQTVSLTLEEGRTEPYGTVIVATGYGGELEMEGISVTSYWTPDELEKKRRSGRQFVVGGCGDGGLIDALRLAHGRFTQSWQAFSLAAAIDREAEQVAKIIRRAEYDGLMMLKSIRAMNRGDEPHEAEKDVHLFLYEEYNKAVDKLPFHFRKALDASLLERPGPRPGDIKLAGLEAKPTTPYAAPIHKLMIVHAVSISHIDWIPGRLEISPEKVPYVGTTKLNGCIPILRYGAASSLEDLLKTNEIDSLRLRQIMLADRIESGIRRDAQAPKGYPQRDVTDLKFINSRDEAAKMVTAAIDPRYTADATANGFKYVRIDPTGVLPPDSGIASGITLPGKLFGITAQDGTLANYPTLGDPW